MISVKINVPEHIAEYITAKYYDNETGCVRFPANSDIYVMIFDLLQRRPQSSPVDTGNLEFALPDRRIGKSPETYNYLSARSASMLADKMRLMMWSELHDFMDEQKHDKGQQFKDSVFIFMRRYSIESISEDALLKNYQRWRYKVRRRKKRPYRS